jgi:uncharacterized protein YkwD
MWRAIRFLALTVLLGGCASTAGLTSFSDGALNRDAPPPKPAPEQAQSQSSGLGGIWANFSSTFSSGEPPAPSAPKPVPEPPALDPNEALRLINEYRSTKGLGAVALDMSATGAAEALAKDMAQHDRMSHTGPRGADMGKRLISAGYSYRVAAENVAVGQKTLAEVVEGWKKSAPHSRNMLLAEAKHMGIAYEYKPDTKYKTFWTLVVAAP